MLYRLNMYHLFQREREDLSTAKSKLATTRDMTTGDIRQLMLPSSSNAIDVANNVS